ncbi:MAG: response regulator transcription factor [Verrucomicrobiaceae bacterium]|nr:MAG: response regulator transcription factor [Verrucomicrobiaceae bacterium]
MTPASENTAVHRVAIVEDRRDVREQWASLLGSFEGFSCVCACPSGEDALEKIPPLKPDIVLMDIFLPRMSGIECTVRLKEVIPDSRVLILTASDDEEMVFPALEAGADGYLLKHSTPDELHQALLDILQGGVPMTSGIARRVAGFFRRRGKARDEVVRLSQRETEVLDLLSKGFVNKEIADRLSLSVETIRSYLKNIYEKMHVHSRAEAVAKYITGGGAGGNTRT